MQGHVIADEQIHENNLEAREIYILIGADHIWEICQDRTIKSGRLRAIESKLGWLVMGPSGILSKIESPMSSTNATIVISALTTLGVRNKQLNSAEDDNLKQIS